MPVLSRNDSNATFWQNYNYIYEAYRARPTMLSLFARPHSQYQARTVFWSMPRWWHHSISATDTTAMMNTPKAYFLRHLTPWSNMVPSDSSINIKQTLFSWFVFNSIGASSASTVELAHHSSMLQITVNLKPLIAQAHYKLYLDWQKLQPSVSSGMQSILNWLLVHIFYTGRNGQSECGQILRLYFGWNKSRATVIHGSNDSML